MESQPKYKPLIIVICVVAYYGILVATLSAAANGWSKSAYYDTTGEFLLLFIVLLPVLPFAQFLIGNELIKKGSQNVGVSLRKAALIEIISSISIIALAILYLTTVNWC
jgi:hypothetical protein